MTLDELVEVHAQELGRDAQVTTEVEALRKVDHAMLVSRILLLRLANVIHICSTIGIPNHAASGEYRLPQVLADEIVSYF